MGIVIKLSDYISRWNNVFAAERDDAYITCSVNSNTGEANITICSYGNENALCVRLTTVEAVTFAEALNTALGSIGKR